MVALGPSLDQVIFPKGFMRRTPSPAKVQGCGVFYLGSIVGNYKHGLSKSALYKKWAAMKRRCSCPKDSHYHLYGGRGIYVCNEWLKNPVEFITWAFNNGYRKGLTIDRIDCDGPYSPQNCRWVTWEKQNQNLRKRKGTTSKFKGVHWDRVLNKWRAKINPQKRNLHLGYFDSEEDAARAYDNAAFIHFGKDARINF